MASTWGSLVVFPVSTHLRWYLPGLSAAEVLFPLPMAWLPITYHTSGLVGIPSLGLRCIFCIFSCIFCSSVNICSFSPFCFFIPPFIYPARDSSITSIDTVLLKFFQIWPSRVLEELCPLDMLPSFFFHSFVFWYYRTLQVAFSLPQVYSSALLQGALVPFVEEWY